YYRASDAALLPTWSDPFANVTLEAIPWGTPLVTTKYNGGCEVVLPGNNGYVADHPTNAKALAEGINTMLSRRHEPDRAAAISATVADYTMARNWSKTLAVVKKAVSGIPKVNHELNEK
ncbi:MAG: glycosyltransferase, partial [Verrucomicrobia bacterium]|nr:glycosyltransferase [Verrucomicrobiota bacterium]